MNHRSVIACYTSLVLLVVPSLSVAQGQLTETTGQIRFANSHYLAIIDRQLGGALVSLSTADGKQKLISDHRLYTDFGFYEQRGSVSTREEITPEITVTKSGDSVCIESRGYLRGQPTQGQPLLAYTLSYTFDQTPRIHVSAMVTPPASMKNVSGFLASCFVVPAMAEWAANTVDGVIREDAQMRVQRNYDSATMPLDGEAPAVGFLTRSGASLLVHKITPGTASPMQGVIVHGDAFFLAWLSGQPVDLEGDPLTVTFDLVVGRGDPMRK